MTVPPDEAVDLAVTAGETTDVDAQMRRLAHEIRDDLPHLVEVQLEALARLVPYRGLPREELIPSCTRNALRIVAAVGGERIPSDLEIEHEQESLRLRMQRGISSDDAHDAYRVVVGALRDAVLAEGRVRHLPAEVLLLAVQRIWRLHDEVMAQVVARRNSVELAVIARQLSARATFFTELFEGRLLPDELAEIGPRYDLQPSASYWFALCDSSSDEMVTLLEQEGRGDGRPALVAFHHGRLAGVLPRSIEGHPAFDHVTVACVGPHPTTEILQATHVASGLLRAADAFAIKGVVTEESMGLRLSIARDPAMGELLHRRYIDPVGTGAAADDLIATVRAFLLCDRSVVAAAAAVFVHANTVRYRLAKFCDLTGADFDSVSTIAELWWAFEYESVRGRLDGTPPGPLL